jgi:hypothetical protein
LGHVLLISSLKRMARANHPLLTEMGQ